MAKEKMITRTFVMSNVNCMVCNTDTASVTDQTFTLFGEFTAAQAEKALKKQFAHATQQIVMVHGVERVEKLMGMPESEFFSAAIELPPRG